MMQQAYLVFRSVTGGQRAKGILDQAGLPSSLRRSPRQLSQNGCAYALTVSAQNLNRALRQLRAEQAEPESVYLRRSDGGDERVAE